MNPPPDYFDYNFFWFLVVDFLVMLVLGRIAYKYLRGDFSPKNKSRTSRAPTLP
jgi:hypothetical protein